MSDFVPMASIGIGAYLLWFGIHYWRDENHYPHSVIKSVVSGGSLPARSEAASTSAADEAQLNADVTAAITDSGPSGASNGYGTDGSIDIGAINTADLTAVPAQTAIGTGANAQNWAGAILTALGAPVNSANVSSMVAWFGAEDNHGAAGAGADGVGANNPLDVTPSSGSFAGSTGTEASGAGSGHPGNIDFDTPADGIAATAEEIGNYSAIASALKAGTGLIGNSAVSSELSEWSGGGYSSLS